MIISQFYDITVSVHEALDQFEVQAEYAGDVGVFDVKKRAVVKGYFPEMGTELVCDWIDENEAELLEMLESGDYRQLPALE